MQVSDCKKSFNGLAIASVSVVIPCYRNAKTIERALASVAAQTQQPAEVILIDDASDDGTRDRLIKLSQQFAHGWVKLILLDQNVGAGCSRNKGWAAATQRYVAFLDADDAWHPRKIEIQYNFMNKHSDVVLCGHDFHLLKEAEHTNWNVDILPELVIGKMAMLLSNRFVTPSVMIQRQTSFRFIDQQRYMEDHMLWLQVVCSGASVVKLPMALTAIYKSPFGVKGLSSHLWMMERSDLGNYHRLYRDGCITGVQLALLMTYSILKHIRRLVIYIGYIRWIK